MSASQSGSPAGSTTVASAAIAGRAEATRAALVAAARRLFVEKGYFATGTEEIVAAAGVGTRGALYHHFANKQALFMAVFQEVEEQLHAAAPKPEQTRDALSALSAGLLRYLKSSLTGEVQRILLIEGPAVLGWKEWRDLQVQFGLGEIRDLLEQAVSEGTLTPQPLDVLAHILLAATDEAALFIANAANPGDARDQAVLVLSQLLQGLRTRP